MRVAVIGGTGFVGGYIVDELLAHGHEPALLVRKGSSARLRQADRCRLVEGDLDSPAAIRDTVENADAVIYLVGILRERPAQGITFERLQYRGVVDTLAAAAASGVRRLVLMSANGVEARATPYQDTKYRAEQAVAESGLDYTVFRPSVIFGDPQGRMEFATQLCRDMVRPPLPAVAFRSRDAAGDGQIRMSPVHVEDVAAAFVAALDDASLTGRTLVLAGPEVLTWSDMLERIGRAVGRQKIVLPMPVRLMRLAASALDRFEFFPVTRDQLTMLVQGNTGSPDAVREILGREPKPFSPEALAYLAAG
ncbi:MAG: NAD(P)H-binding protein [Woeseiaceae bacterium]|nr:NAD(P)H-binding protein [Woeseiaceae bacterium]